MKEVYLAKTLNEVAEVIDNVVVEDLSKLTSRSEDERS
jgi:hypothetical protein